MNASPPRRRDREDAERMNLVRASISHRLGFELREGQELAGRQMLRRCVVEMPTGEGKTVATVFPAVTLARRYRNVLIATANDYLAVRDANWMHQIYEDLGLSVGSVSAACDPGQRKRAYECSITYGTLREFGFDFLRGSLAQRACEDRMDSPSFKLDALIVDEADSGLIDEARMPMILTAPTQRVGTAVEACYRWCAEFASVLQRTADFHQDADTGAISLTTAGHRQFVREPMPTSIHRFTSTEILHSLERAIWVRANLRSDHDYIVGHQQIGLVDQYTGRKSSNRKFGLGVQQAIEAKEGLAITPESRDLARITVQEFALQFQHLSGITATIREDRHELRSVYGLDVQTVQPHQSSQRIDLDPMIVRSQDEKWKSIASETLSVVQSGRAVLIGTCSIAESELLSNHFATRDIDHVVLNAKHPAEEASIVAQAGQRGRVTIATNMAGRGTDIRLAKEVASAGGLHVIVSQPHAAKRIDRQLQGRCARGGDPGTTRVYIGSEDRIFIQSLGEEQARRLAEAAETASDSWIAKQATRAQRLVAVTHRKQRAQLAAHSRDLAQSLETIGLHPHLDPLPSDT